ncbi:hypothetical protein DSECCO2_630560 [anaerobic digester metagenome]
MNAPWPVIPLTKRTVADALTSRMLKAKTSRSAWETISPLVTTTISAYFSIGPIFLGVLTPERLSMTHTARMAFTYGEHRLQRPALSVIRTDNPFFMPHSTALSTLLTKK